MKVKNAVAKIQNKSRSDGNMPHNLLKEELDLLENIIRVDKPILKSIVINVDLKKLKMITVNIVVLVEECVYSWDVVLGENLGWHNLKASDVWKLFKLPEFEDSNLLDGGGVRAWRNNKVNQIYAIFKK